jgi:hypothetical protein
MDAFRRLPAATSECCEKTAGDQQLFWCLLQTPARIGIFAKYTRIGGSWTNSSTS